MKKLILPLILLSIICNALSCSNNFKEDSEKDKELILTIASVKRSIYSDLIYNPPYFAKTHLWDEWTSFDWIEGLEYEEIGRAHV